MLQSSRGGDQKVSQSIELKSILIWIICACFFLLEYVVRVAPSVMESQLRMDFSVDAFAIGTFASLFYWPYISMQLPVGAMVDRFGPQRLLLVMAFLCGLACVLFAQAESFWLASCARVLMGFSAAFAFVGTLKMVLIWFPMAYFPLFASLTQALGMLGAIVGEAPMSWLLQFYTWRQAMLFCAAMFVLLGFSFLLFPKESLSTKGMKHKTPNIFEGLKVVLCRPSLWFNAAFGGFLYASTAAFAEMWGPSFFHYAYGLSAHDASQVVVCIFVGWIIGAPVVGWLANRLPSRSHYCALSALVCGMTLGLVLYFHQWQYWHLCVLMLIYGFFNASLMLAYANAGEIKPESASGASMAFANMASVLVGGSLLQPVIGRLLDAHWSGEVDLLGDRVYSLSAMHNSFWVLPLCFVIAFVLAFFVPERRRWESHSRL